jgi:hypothetical protein
MPMSLRERRIGIDPVLTTIVRGWKNATLVGTALCPIVPSPKRSGKVVAFGKEAFATYKTKRSVRGYSNRIEWGYSADPYNIDQHSLEHLADLTEIQETEGTIGIGYEAATMSALMGAHALNLEKEIADVVANPANYDANHKTILTGNDKWSVGEGASRSRPFRQVKDWAQQIRRSIGIKPNTLFLGSEVFDALDDHEDIRDRIKHTSRETLTPEMLAEMWGLVQVIVGDAVHLAEGEGEELGDMAWGKSAILAYVNPNAIGRGVVSYTPTIDVSMQEPSAFYTYVLDGMPAAETPYEERAQKSIVYGVNYDRQVVVTGQGAAFLAQEVI